MRMNNLTFDAIKRGTRVLTLKERAESNDKMWYRQEESENAYDTKEANAIYAQFKEDGIITIGIPLSWFRGDESDGLYYMSRDTFTLGTMDGREYIIFKNGLEVDGGYLAYSTLKYIRPPSITFKDMIWRVMTWEKHFKI